MEWNVFGRLDARSSFELDVVLLMIMVVIVIVIQKHYLYLYLCLCLYLNSRNVSKRMLLQLSKRYSEAYLALAVVVTALTVTALTVAVASLYPIQEQIDILYKLI